LLAVRGVSYNRDQWMDGCFGGISLTLPHAVAIAGQAFGSRDGLVLFLDGSIFNGDELRRTLVGNNAEALTHSPTLCLHLFERHGPAFVKLLNGQFNIVIYAAKTRRVIVANDRLAYRPLFYSTANRRLSVACEQKAVLSAIDVPREFDSHGILQLFAFGHHLDDTTIFRNVSAFPQGTIAEYDVNSSDLRLERYWRPRLVPRRDRSSLRDNAHELGQRLVSAVSSRLKHCHKPGLFLSGGLDSRAVAGALHCNGATVNSFTFSNSSRPPHHPDIRYAGEVAATLGFSHHEIRVPTDAYVTGLPRVVWRTECTMPYLHSLSIELHRHVGPHVDSIFNGHFGDTLSGIRFLPGLFSCRTRSDIASRIMTMRACLSLPALQRLFRDDFLRITYPEIADSVRRHLDTFDEHHTLLLYKMWNLTVRQRRFTFSSPMVDRYLFEQLSPFVDNDIVDWTLSMPWRHLFMESAYKNMIVRCFPHIAQVPWEHTHRPIPSSTWKDIAGEVWRGAFVISNRIWHRFSRPAKRDARMADSRLRSKIERYCHSDAFCSNVLDGTKVKALLSDHFDGQGGCPMEVALLATLAEGSRLFVENQFSSPPEDAEPVLLADSAESN
jgi:asparagine synthase (glutamine-hydrolysing)